MPKFNLEKITSTTVKGAGIVASLAVAGAITLFSAALMKASILVLISKKPIEVSSEPKTTKKAPKKAKNEDSKAE